MQIRRTGALSCDSKSAEGAGGGAGFAFGVSVCFETQLLGASARHAALETRDVDAT